MTSQRTRRGATHTQRQHGASNDDKGHSALGDRNDNDDDSGPDRPDSTNRNDVTAFLKAHGGLLTLLFALFPTFFAMTRIYILAGGSYDNLTLLANKMDFTRLAQVALVASFPEMFIVASVVILATTYDREWHAPVAIIIGICAAYCLSPLMFVLFLVLALGGRRTLGRLQYLADTPWVLRGVVPLVGGIILVAVSSLASDFPREAIVIGTEKEATVSVIASDDNQITLFYENGSIRLIAPNDIRSRTFCSDRQPSPDEVLLFRPTAMLVIDLMRTRDIGLLMPKKTLGACPG